MKKFKNFPSKKPVLFSLLLILIALFLKVIPLKNMFSLFIDNQYASYLQEIIENSFLIILVVIIIIQLRLIQNVGFTHHITWKDLVIVWPVVTIILLSFFSQLNGSMTIDTSRPMLIVLYILANFSTGLFEEILMRGAVLFLMLHKWGNTQKGIYLSVIVSSVLFGIAHIGNYFVTSESLGDCITQIVCAIFIGIIFAAYILKTNSIWLVIVLHAFFDISANINEIAIGGGIETNTSTTLVQALVIIAINFLLCLYGLFVLRKVTPSSLQSNSSNMKGKEKYTSSIRI